MNAFFIPAKNSKPNHKESTVQSQLAFAKCHFSAFMSSVLCAWVYHGADVLEFWLHILFGVLKCCNMNYDA